MKKDIALESANQKIKKALKETVQSDRHNVSVILTDEERKAFLYDFCLSLTKPSNQSQSD